MKKIIRKWAAPALCGLFIFLLFRTVFFIGYVPSPSMEPTIRAGSFVFGYRVVGEIRHGDILVFHHGGQTLVKRVAAVPGDTVYIDGSGNASVNKEPPDTERILSVPSGYYFMLGDNAEDSIDSRVWDEPFVGRGQVVARIWRG